MDTTALKGKGQEEPSQLTPLRGGLRGFLGYRTFGAEVGKIQGKPGHLATLHLDLVISYLGKWLQKGPCLMVDTHGCFITGQGN